MWKVYGKPSTRGLSPSPTYDTGAQGRARDRNMEAYLGRSVDGLDFFRRNVESRRHLALASGFLGACWRGLLYGGGAYYRQEVPLVGRVVGPSSLDFFGESKFRRYVIRGSCGKKNREEVVEKKS